MAQTVSTKFSNAQQSPANLPVAQVQLLLGNYFNAAVYGTVASSNGDDASGVFPASGAIDGDRTEINRAGPNTADNGVGKSTWLSAGNASPGTPAILTLTMSQARTVNRIKLYHQSSDPLTAYHLSYYDGSTWVVAASCDGSGGVLFTSAHSLDVIDFPDVTATQWRLTILGSANGGQAEVVEIEAYRKMDITSRVKGVKVSRQRDYKLSNPMAATVQLDCINTDRFFSITHVPTAAETAAGFVNQELRPNLQVLVNFGFNLYGALPEMVPSIVAYLDAITIKPKTRTCVLSGRDGMKALINQVDSSNLKTNIELSAAILYMLNRGNVSTFETRLSNTDIFIPYFFTDQEDHLTTIRNLVQASGDSLFYFDESGIAVFQFYTGNLPLSRTYPVDSPWASGALGGNMEVNGSNQLQLDIQYVNPHTFSNAGAFTSTGLTAATSNRAIQAFAQSFEVPYATKLTAVDFTIVYQSVSGAAGTFNVWSDAGGGVGSVLYSVSVPMSTAGFVQTTLAVHVTPNLDLAGGRYWYGLQADETSLVTINSGIVNTATPAQTPPGLPPPYSQSQCLGTNSSSWELIRSQPNIGNPNTIVVNWGTYTFEETSGTGTWTSPVIDTGSSTTSFSPLVPTAVPNGNTVQYLTRSSSDNVHFSAFVATASNGQPLSPLARYLQVQVSMTQNRFSGVSAIVLDLEVNWVGGQGTRKYAPAPSSFTLNYNSNLLDVAQELADNLGGDTSIINQVSVQAAPLTLAGLDSDTVWQATIGSPPVNVSVSTPLTLLPGVYLYSPAISGGMDTSRMSGVNPAAAVITGAAGTVVSWQFSTISPTQPVLLLNVEAGGTITDFRIIGKTFSSQNTAQAAVASDVVSIQNYGNRQQSVQNIWIVSSQIAQVIANNIVSVFSNPFSYIPSFALQPTFSAQIGDRVTVQDINLDISKDYVIIGLDQDFHVNGDQAGVQTTGKLLAVPAGL